ncbi:MAG: Ig-like domain-containing protein [Chloroflexi bacterium]|nr:Ig-like domain-containing protein [Chloroflexota bacterium]
MLLGPALLVSVAPGARAQDETPPTAELFVPQTGAGVPRDPLVSVFFSEQVSGVTPSSVRLRDAKTGTWAAVGRFWYDSCRTVPASGTPRPALVRRSSSLWYGGTVLAVDAQDLRAHHRYRVVVSSVVRDVAGNPFTGASWRFSTGC